MLHDEQKNHNDTLFHLFYLDHLNSAKVLLQAGADPNVSKHHMTPLHEAARCQDIELVALLLDHGADVYACNRYSNKNIVVVFALFKLGGCVFSDCTVCVLVFLNDLNM